MISAFGIWKYPHMIFFIWPTACSHTVHVWTQSELGLLVPIMWNLNATVALADILTISVFPNFWQQVVEGSSLFHRVSPPVRKAKFIKNGFPQSPDLNPIKHLWNGLPTMSQVPSPNMKGSKSLQPGSEVLRKTFPEDIAADSHPQSTDFWPWSVYIFHELEMSRYNVNQIKSNLDLRYMGKQG